MSTIQRLIAVTDAYLYYISKLIVDEGTGRALVYQSEFDPISYPFRRQGYMDISTLPDEECKYLFKFTFSQIQSLAVLLELGEKVCFREGSPSQFFIPSTEALTIMLRRMTFPARVANLTLFFGRSECTLITIFNEMIEKLYERFHTGLEFDTYQFREENLVRFSEAISKTAPTSECVGFIDGLFNRSAKPDCDQEVISNEYSSEYGLKYQAVVTPDGITSSIMGPEIGNPKDMNFYENSGLENSMREAFDFKSSNGPCYYVYGDKNYTESALIMAPFHKLPLDEVELDINKTMAGLHRVVGNEFTHVGNLWEFLRYSQTQRSDQSSFELYYTVGTFLKNIHVCYNGGNHTSRMFGVTPPTPDDYIYGLLCQ
ncbi:hypothetical protein PHYBLDRAFT_70755 [Phycomyces blakesleeanus NRRL 1555(-)]|uniref:DDE Tnp4 domain-containing protein n=1 Tax=Phycomyces blakesleeanus (strain ATCC 8743b / DSM 1359 / FGSC 10004 / NBRC 33097 / NRRL 1555) TaxID=763407 RepID=A0A162N417_PHYB8|nr:hypothetical protein PHYBLDRAFT_70755 [Phycomyces blakesleeanus NRRL 1555(-)]OAD65634.1 hypothetical protein PHYBLDRAFT_70755 [Phycomyces blakesleeanus NRRL 1555(-)]|eukprot:XP_018283674.1 hypothetical protein PHYBLDRAFT_70755 [Phycomyces blakesleeanus NRRL 1555(-)]